MPIYDEKMQARKRAFYVANREKIIAKRAAHYAANRERIKAEARKWWAAHPQTEEQKKVQRERRRRHYLANRERTIEQVKKYREQHPDVLIRSAIACNNRRRAQKQGSVVDLKGIKNWMREIRTKPFVRCHWCGTKVAGRKIHFDHIIALSRGGTHTIGNLCAACADCNLAKKARVLSRWIVNNQSFLSL